MKLGMKQSYKTRKWKWDKHGAPKSQRLSSITEVQQDESNDAISM